MTLTYMLQRMGMEGLADRDRICYQASYVIKSQSNHAEQWITKIFFTKVLHNYKFTTVEKKRKTKNNVSDENKNHMHTNNFTTSQLQLYNYKQF